jgi:2-phosphosulfolactate phosphatase
MTHGPLEVTWNPAGVAALPGMDLARTLCVVIDVLRATTTITAALAAGARGVVPVTGVDEARAERDGHFPDALLCGERMGVAPEGFDLGNSPREFTADRVAGCVIVHTTTNGTRALRACAHAAEVWCGCFWSLAATAETVRAGWARGLSVRLICAGSWEEFALEDALFAGAVCDALDCGHAVRSVWRGRVGSLEECLGATLNGRHLHHIGLAADVAACARVDAVSFVPRFNHGVVTR